MRTNRRTDVLFDTTKVVIAILGVLRMLKLQIRGSLIFVFSSKRVAE